MLAPRGGTCVPVTCELRGTGAGSAVDVYLYGWNTGGAWGGGSGSLMILAGVLVHRAARPQRQSVFLVVVRWSVPGVSIQLTFSHKHLHSTLDSCKACGMRAKKQSFGVRRNPHLNLTFTLTLGLEKTPLFLEVSIARREALGGPCARRERL